MRDLKFKIMLSCLYSVETYNLHISVCEFVIYHSVCMMHSYEYKSVASYYRNQEITLPLKPQYIYVLNLIPSSTYILLPP